MKAVYKLHADCGRMGQLDGLFIAHKEDVQKLIASKVEVYFGEVLGKHSEVYGELEEKDISMVSDDPNVVDIIETHELETGFNPMHYTTVNAEALLGDKYKDDLTVKEVLDLLES